MSTGAFYCMSITNVIQDELIDALQVSQDKFFELYSIPGYPTIALCFFTGYLLDCVGFRLSSFIFTFLVLIGQIINSIGVYNQNFNVVLTAFIIQNYSIEATLMVQNSLTTLWFKNSKQIGFAMGVLMFQIRMTEFISSWIIPPLYNYHKNVQTPLIGGIIICLFSFIISAVGASFMDYLREKKKKQIKIQNENNININQHDSLLSEQLSVQQEQDDDQIVNKKFINLKKIKIRDFFKLNRLYWLNNALCAFGYTIFYPFMYNMESILKGKFKIDLTYSGRLQSIPYFFALGAPLVGLLVDKIGKRPQILIFGFICLFLSFLTWIIIPDCQQTCIGHPILPLVLLGIFFIIFSGIIFSCISLTLIPDVTGLGFGLVSSIKSIGLSVAPTINTAIIDNYGYIWLYMFQLILSILAIVIAFTIYYIDSKNNNILINPGKKNSHQYNKSNQQ